MLVPFLLHPAPELLERHARHCRSHAGVIAQVRNPPTGEEPGGQEPTAPSAKPEYLLEPLSPSEARILRYLPTNLTAPEIAGQLYLSVHTVKTHIRHVYCKLGAHGRREAVERARAYGLLPSAVGRP
jgi:LuxR family transcriptional regulator, maltose regulon positive regulatory protein